MIIEGLKGYERLLSLSKDKENPKWKPLHVSGKWNSRNRRMAKLKTKNNWFKGKDEVDLPDRSTGAGQGLGGSRLDTTLVPPPTMQEEMLDTEGGLGPGGSRLDTTPGSP